MVSSTKTYNECAVTQLDIIPNKGVVTAYYQSPPPPPPPTPVVHIYKYLNILYSNYLCILRSIYFTMCI